jgi:hypothetical protein
MIADITTPTAVAKLLAFDSTKRSEPVPVDLDSPFFEIHYYPAAPATCDHRQRGFTLDVATRTAICKCGVTVDTFDALLFYAHAQQRLIHHAETIKEHARKEAEEKAKRPFVQEVSGFEAQFANTKRTDRHGRLLGWSVTLACGHRTYWQAAGRFRRHPPRRITCTGCYDASVRAAQLAAVDVAQIPERR